MTRNGRESTKLVREHQENRLILDEKYCRDTWRGKRGGDTRTKINRKRKENIRCQGWISFALRQVRAKLIYMRTGRCNFGVRRHFLCRNITQIYIYIYRVTQKKRELLKTPTKIEEIQEKKLLTGIDLLQLAF